MGISITIKLVCRALFGYHCVHILRIQDGLNAVTKPASFSTRVIQTCTRNANIITEAVRTSIDPDSCGLRHCQTDSCGNPVTSWRISLCHRSNLQPILQTFHTPRMSPFALAWCGIESFCNSSFRSNEIYIYKGNLLQASELFCCKSCLARRFITKGSFC